ncbi:MAG: xanthine dehydrogenase, partial [Calditrichaeota bacterium]
MSMNDLHLHVKGASQFVDDLTEPPGLLHGVVLTSPIAHGEIKSLNFDAALKIPGIVAIFIAGDIPGQNQIGNIIQDEVLLAEKQLDFIGQPIALVVGCTTKSAKRAAELISMTYKEKTPVLDAREAFRKNLLISPPRTFNLGNIQSAWDLCDFILDGQVHSGGQEHVYLETQTALAIPGEDGGVKIYSATQSASLVQKTAARVLGLATNRIEVEVPRLGGAFGGK